MRCSRFAICKWHRFKFAQVLVYTMEGNLQWSFNATSFRVKLQQLRKMEPLSLRRPVHCDKKKQTKTLPQPLRKYSCQLVQDPHRERAWASVSASSSVWRVLNVFWAGGGIEKETLSSWIVGGVASSDFEGREPFLVTFWPLLFQSSPLPSFTKLLEITTHIFVELPLTCLVSSLCVSSTGRGEEVSGGRSQEEDQIRPVNHPVYSCNQHILVFILVSNTDVAYSYSLENH